MSKSFSEIFRKLIYSKFCQFSACRLPFYPNVSSLYSFWADYYNKHFLLVIKDRLPYMKSIEYKMKNKIWHKYPICWFLLLFMFMFFLLLFFFGFGVENNQIILFETFQKYFIIFCMEINIKSFILLPTTFHTIAITILSILFYFCCLLCFLLCNHFQQANTVHFSGFTKIFIIFHKITSMQCKSASASQFRVFLWFILILLNFLLVFNVIIHYWLCKPFSINFSGYTQV